MDSKRWLQIRPFVPALAGGIVGIVCGLVSHTSFLEGRWIDLAVWAVGGLGLGWFMQETGRLVWCGVVYGFVLSVTFLVSGFQGSANNIPAFLVLTLILSLFGILGGLAAVFIGSRIRRLVA